MKKIKIAFVLDTMIYGGIERVAINYLSSLDSNKYDIDVFILNSKTEGIIEDIPKYCNIIKWNISRKVCPEAYWKLAIKYNGGVGMYILISIILNIATPILKLIAKLKYKKYDLTVAFSGHYNDLYVAGKILNTRRKIAWLHGALYSYLSMSPAFIKLYQKFDKLVVLSNLAQSEMELIYPQLENKIIKITNPIKIYKSEKFSKCKVDELKSKYGDFILMAGRMNTPKDYITVIDSIKLIHKKYGEKIKAVFIGDGPDRINIENYIEENNMNDYIFLEGNVHDVENYYKSAKVLVHSSLYEGLPTVLLEAMATGLPVIATDSPPGVREILENNKYGLICNIKDSEDMATQILKLYRDEELFNYYVKKSKERILDFLEEKKIKELELLINDLLSCDLQ